MQLPALFVPSAWCRFPSSFCVFISAIIVHVTISVGSSKPRLLRTASRASAQDDSGQLMLEATRNHRIWEESVKQSCGEENVFEDVADKLAYQLFRDLPADASDVTFVPKLAEGLLSGALEVSPGKTLPAQVKAAAARLQGWWIAVARVQHQRPRAKPATHTKLSAAKQKAVEGSGDGADRLSDNETKGKLTTRKVHPPPCAWSLPAEDPYWSQKDSYWVCEGPKCSAYNVCEYSDGCKRNFTNAERVNSIRATLKTTGNFLRKLEVPYILVGGSAIGAYRCKDVLPWDLDSDVAIPQTGMSWLLNFMGLDGKGHKGNGSSVDLAQYGFPGFLMMEKYPGCQPLVIVDRSTGFLTDIFPMQIGPNMEHIYLPWWNGNRACDSKKLFNGCEHNTCEVWSLEDTVPFSECRIYDTKHTCTNSLQRFLYQLYGLGIEEPNVKTRTATTSARANALWDQIQVQAHGGAANVVLRSRLH